MQFTLKKREALGKNQVKQLRKTGAVPGIIYGLEKEPILVQTTRRGLIDLFKNDNGQNIVFEADVDGEKVDDKLIVYKLDRDAISLEVIHVDFMRVKTGRNLKVKVPIQLVGKAPGLKLGGVLVQKVSSLLILTSPENIPAKISIDLSALNVGDFIKVKSLDTGGKFSFLTNGDENIVQIAASRKMTDLQMDAISEAGTSNAEASK